MLNRIVSFLVVAVFLAITYGCSAEKPEQAAEEPVKSQAQDASDTQPPTPSQEKTDTVSTGEALFKKHCITCHKNGGNILNKEKPIGRAALAERGITTPEDIVEVMRNPGPKMKRIDESVVPDAEARMIGEYILKTFE